LQGYFLKNPGVCLLAQSKSPLSKGLPQTVNLERGLAALYTFDNTSKEGTGQRADAVPTLAKALTYTTDRKGIPGNAIEFNGRYGLNIQDILWQQGTSVAAWVKFNQPTTSTYLILFGYFGPALGQDGDKYFGSISTPQTTGVSSAPMDNPWHHLVATYDGVNLKFFVDGQYVGISNNYQSIGIGSGNYTVGYMNTSFWVGSIDDLHFYSRALNVAEVQELYKK
jgi:hypothetical protein